MRTNLYFFLLAAAVTLGISSHVLMAQQPAAAQVVQKKKWEYLTVTLYAVDLEFDGKTMPLDRGLDYLGERGWELVTIARYTSDSYRVCIFKRPL